MGPSPVTPAGEEHRDDYACAAEVTGQIPDGAGMMQFGLVLRGPGRAEMRGAGLTVGR